MKERKKKKQRERGSVGEEKRQNRDKKKGELR